MQEVEALFPTYFAILSNEQQAQYLQTKQIPVEFATDEQTEELWKKHDNAVQQWNVKDTIQQPNLLDLKIELATRIYHACHFCHHHCGINRETSIGKCKVQSTKITSEFIHLGEETLLVPSYTIFFSGCTLECVFCQNWDISQSNTGVRIEPQQLAQIIAKQAKQSIRNINWVGGDPTPHIFYILQVLKKCSVNLPQIWNSNMYCSQYTMALLHGVMDVYLTDFKFGNNSCAQRLCQVEEYIETVQRNHRLAADQGEVIIRHLILPNHISCCSIPILQWIHDNIPFVGVNIMSQYRPEYKASEYTKINRKISQSEFYRVVSEAQKIHINIL